MTKRDCEAFFGLIEETLRNVPNTGAEHAKRVACNARELLAAEREERAARRTLRAADQAIETHGVALVPSPELDEHDDEIEGRLLIRLEREGLLTTTATAASDQLNGIVEAA